MLMAGSYDVGSKIREGQAPWAKSGAGPPDVTGPDRGPRSSWSPANGSSTLNLILICGLYALGNPVLAEENKTVCGICGIAYSDREYMQPLDQLDSMCSQMVHRGPDDSGCHIEPGISLGFRRLSIIDIEGGHQPITNEDCSLYLICNGEIYNHLELRRSLEKKGHRFSTHSDVEVILHLYEEEGKGLLEHLEGMFAFALWNRDERDLMLARDRLGIKPLYYSFTPRRLAFASEIKALLVLPDTTVRPNLDVLDEYLTYRYIRAPNTFFQGIKKVTPASFAIYGEGAFHEKRYWDYLSASCTDLDEDECAEQLFELLSQTVTKHMQSEVPVGIFLSSGLDSNIILALAADRCSDISTFSLGFSMDGQHANPDNELARARLQAEKFNTRHREIEVSAGDVEESLFNIVSQIEEPLGDPTSIPLHAISREVGNEATVVLSGEGADEIFAGYASYLAPDALRALSILPKPLRRLVMLPLAERLPGGTPGKNFLKRASTEVPDWYRGVGYTFERESRLKLYSKELRSALHDPDQRTLSEAERARVAHLHPIDQMLYIDSKYFLPEDTLLKSRQTDHGEQPGASCSISRP